MGSRQVVFVFALLVLAVSALAGPTRWRPGPRPVDLPSRGLPGCTAALSLGTGSGFAGSSDNAVPVTLTHDTAVRAVQMTVTDVPDVLTASGCTSRVAGFTCDVSATGRLLFLSLSGAEVPRGTDVPLFDLLYDVDAGAGSGPVALAAGDLVIPDADSQPCAGSASPGSFEVLEGEGCAATVRVGLGSGDPGSEGNPVTVYLTGNTPLRALELDVVDSPDVLALQGCLPLIADFDCEASEAGGVLLVSFSGETIPAGTDVPVLELLYEVNPAAAGVVNLVPQNLVFPDEDSRPCPAQGVAGHFDVGEQCDASVDLDLGWTFVGACAVVDYNAADLCADLAEDGCGIAEVDRWNLGGWEGHICGLPFNNFPILPGEGYFVRSDDSCTWCQQGPVIPSPLDISLATGWTAVAFPTWAELDDAPALCRTIDEQGGAATEIDRWVNGSWEGHVCGLPFNAFPVDSCRGYFALSGAPSTLSFSRPVRTSNVNDTSFAVSWITETPRDCQVNYGDTPDLGQTAPDDRGAGTVDDTHHVTLSGLTPSTPYYFDLECGGVVDDNGGSHYMQTTGPTLAISSPDTTFGKVLRSDQSDATGAIVYVQVQDDDALGSPGRSGLMSAVIEESDGGFWAVNLGGARTQDLASYFSYSASGDLSVQQAEAGADGRASQEVDTGSDAPSPDMTLASAAPPSGPGFTGRGARRAAAEPRRGRERASPRGRVESNEICERTVANRRDTAFTVAWGTDLPTTGYVLYGTDPGNLDGAACDLRDDDVLCAFRSDTHFVNVTGLKPNTTYHVQVVTGGEPDGDPIEVRTAPTLEPPPSNLVYGQVYREPETRAFAVGAYVCATVYDGDDAGSAGAATPECDLIEAGDDGYFAVNLSSALTPDLAGRFRYSPAADRVAQQTCGAQRGCAGQTLSPAEISPSPPMRLDGECKLATGTDTEVER